MRGEEQVVEGPNGKACRPGRPLGSLQGRGKGEVMKRSVASRPRAYVALVPASLAVIAALALAACGNGAADQGNATASPSKTPSAWFTPEPLGEHRATTREKRMLAAAAEYVRDPKYIWRTDPDDFRKYVGQPGEIVAYVVVLMQKGIEVSVVVDTASGEVHPIATLRGGDDDPYSGVPQWTHGMIPSRSHAVFSKGETWAMDAAKYWFYDHVVEKLDWPAAAKPVVAGYLVGWPDVGVLQLYVQEDDGKPEAWGLGQYLPW